MPLLRKSQRNATVDVLNVSAESQLNNSKPDMSKSADDDTDHIDDDTQPPAEALRMSAGVTDASERQLFKSSTEVFTLLCSDAEVLPSVPRGRNCNLWFLVNNTDNVDRTTGGMRNRFWDDCGVWDTNQWCNLRTVCMRTNQTYETAWCARRSEWPAKTDGILWNSSRRQIAW